MFTSMDISRIHPNVRIDRMGNGRAVASLRFVHASYDTGHETVPEIVAVTEIDHAAREISGSHIHQISLEVGGIDGGYNQDHRFSAKSIITPGTQERSAGWVKHAVQTLNPRHGQNDPRGFGRGCATAIDALAHSEPVCGLAGAILWLELVRALAVTFSIDPDESRMLIAHRLAVYTGNDDWRLHLVSANLMERPYVGDGLETFFAYRTRSRDLGFDPRRTYNRADAVDRIIISIPPWMAPGQFGYHRFITAGEPRPLWERNWTINDVRVDTVGMGPIEVAMPAMMTHDRYMREVLGAFAVPPDELMATTNNAPPQEMQKKSFVNNETVLARQLFFGAFPEVAGTGSVRIMSKEIVSVSYLLTAVDGTHIQVYRNSDYLGHLCIYSGTEVPLHDVLYQLGILLSQGKERAVWGRAYFHCGVVADDMLVEDSIPEAVNRVVDYLSETCRIVAQFGGRHYKISIGTLIHLHVDGTITVDPEFRDMLIRQAGRARSKDKRPIIAPRPVMQPVADWYTDFNG